jgi:hypothetical protein
MGLDDQVLPFLGELVYAWPFYGWGWDGVSDKDPFDIPAPFHMRVTRFWDHLGERRGGIGYVEEPSHAYNGYWVVLSTRHVGVFNFTTAIDDYNISMAPREPTFTDEGWPNFGFGKANSHPRGYCSIAATQKLFHEHQAAKLAEADRRRKEWERRKES